VRECDKERRRKKMASTSHLRVIFYADAGDGEDVQIGKLYEMNEIEDGFLKGPSKTAVRYNIVSIELSPPLPNDKNPEVLIISKGQVLPVRKNEEDEPGVEIRILKGYQNGNQILIHQSTKDYAFLMYNASAKTFIEIVRSYYYDFDLNCDLLLRHYAEKSEYDRFKSTYLDFFLPYDGYVKFVVTLLFLGKVADAGVTRQNVITMLQSFYEVNRVKHGKEYMNSIETMVTRGGYELMADESIDQQYKDYYRDFVTPEGKISVKPLKVIHNRCVTGVCPPLHSSIGDINWYENDDYVTDLQKAKAGPKQITRLEDDSVWFIDRKWVYYVNWAITRFVCVGKCRGEPMSKFQMVKSRKGPKQVSLTVKAGGPPVQKRPKGEGVKRLETGDPKKQKKTDRKGDMSRKREEEEDDEVEEIVYFDYRFDPQTENGTVYRDLLLEDGTQLKEESQHQYEAIKWGENKAISPGNRIILVPEPTQKKEEEVNQYYGETRGKIAERRIVFSKDWIHFLDMGLRYDYPRFDYGFKQCIWFRQNETGEEEEDEEEEEEDDDEREDGDDCFLLYKANELMVIRERKAVYPLTCTVPPNVVVVGVTLLKRGLNDMIMIVLTRDLTKEKKNLYTLGYTALHEDLHDFDKSFTPENHTVMIEIDNLNDGGGGGGLIKISSLMTTDGTVWVTIPTTTCIKLYRGLNNTVLSRDLTIPNISNYYETTLVSVPGTSEFKDAEDLETGGGGADEVKIEAFWVVSFAQSEFERKVIEYRCKGILKELKPGKIALDNVKTLDMSTLFKIITWSLLRESYVETGKNESEIKRLRRILEREKDVEQEFEKWINEIRASNTTDNAEDVYNNMSVEDDEKDDDGQGDEKDPEYDEYDDEEEEDREEEMVYYRPQPPQGAVRRNNGVGGEDKKKEEPTSCLCVFKVNAEDQEPSQTFTFLKDRPSYFVVEKTDENKGIKERSMLKFNQMLNIFYGDSKRGFDTFLVELHI
jgi:hypothetical protein